MKMRVNNQWLTRTAVWASAGALLVSLWAGPAGACQPNPLKAPRPQCQPEQLVYGMCFNPDMAKAASITESPDFTSLFNQTVTRAQAYLDRIEPAPNKVIITDLDETLVNNAAYYSKHQSFSPETWEAWLKDPESQRYHQAVLNLLQDAKERGFSVMFITGRPVEQTADTLAQLPPEIQWDGVFLKPRGIKLTSTLYKAQVHQMLETLGYEIVLNIGDQPSDIGGPEPPAENEFLLPNLMYSIP